MRTGVLREQIDRLVYDRFPLRHRFRRIGRTKCFCSATRTTWVISPSAGRAVWSSSLSTGPPPRWRAQPQRLLLPRPVHPTRARKIDPSTGASAWRADPEIILVLVDARGVRLQRQEDAALPHDNRSGDDVVVLPGQADTKDSSQSLIAATWWTDGAKGPSASNSLSAITARKSSGRFTFAMPLTVTAIRFAINLARRQNELPMPCLCFVLVIVIVCRAMPHVRPLRPRLSLIRVKLRFTMTRNRVFGVGPKRQAQTRI